MQSNYQSLAIDRWTHLSTTTLESLSAADRQIVQQNGTRAELSDIVRGKGAGPAPSMSRLATAVTPLAQALDLFLAHFENSLKPHKVDTSVLWGMVYLNLKVRLHSAIVNRNSLV
jgi:hypothetical protein